MAANDSTPAVAAEAVSPPLHKKKGPQGRGFTPYAPEETHPSQAYSYGIRECEGNVPSTFGSEVAAMVSRPSSTPPDFAPGAPRVFDTVGWPQLAGHIAADDDDALSVQTAPARGEQAVFRTDPEDSTAASVHALGDNVAVTIPTVEKSYRRLQRAQHFCPAPACLLVGNLPAEVSDEILGEAVELEFSVFGRCFACAFRGDDALGQMRPYAILQFQRYYQALHAIRFGQGITVFERPVRVEYSKRAVRTFQRSLQQ